MFMGMGFFWSLEIVSGFFIDGSNDSQAWYIFDGINTLQGLWVFIIFVCKQNVINLMLVTAGMRESERSKAKSRTTNMQMKRMKKAGKEGTGKWQIADGQSEIQSEMSATVM